MFIPSLDFVETDYSKKDTEWLVGKLFCYAKSVNNPPKSGYQRYYNNTALIAITKELDSRREKDSGEEKLILAETFKHIDPVNMHGCNAHALATVLLNNTSYEDIEKLNTNFSRPINGVVVTVCPSCKL